MFYHHPVPSGFSSQDAEGGYMLVTPKIFSSNTREQSDRAGSVKKQHSRRIPSTD
jgi:hypothetical protein